MGGYDYDFGDGWEHTVQLERIEPLEKGMDLPQCVGGRRACPPEDCSGIPGYARLLKILADPDHERHAELSEWVTDLSWWRSAVFESFSASKD
jgi:hypothetical protein